MEEGKEARQYEDLREKINEVSMQLSAQLLCLEVLIAHDEFNSTRLPSAKDAKEVWKRMNDRYLGKNREELRRGRDFTTLRNRIESLANNGKKRSSR